MKPKFTWTTKLEETGIDSVTVYGIYQGFTLDGISLMVGLQSCVLYIDLTSVFIY